MTKTILGALSLVFLSLFPAQSFAALGEADCVALFAAADFNQDGILFGSENDPFNEAMEYSGGKPRSDQPIDMVEFMFGCQKGHFDQLVRVQ